jgi:alpha-mannosidase
MKTEKAHSSVPNDKKEVFLVPYAHLDTQWRWEFPTTIKKYIKNTLEENIHLFEKYPEHRFNFTGALRYQFMKDYYPKMYEKIKKYIKEAKWFYVGTCLDETDTLTPSVESMIRNVLYGDRWAKQEFGITSNDIMIPDCFGFPSNMPSVMAHCGIIGFSSQKLTWNSAVGIPFDLGIWKGPDGSGIVSALNPGSYVSPILMPIHKNPIRLKRLEKFGKKYGIWRSFQYYGVGDIGGAPREKDVINAIKSVKYSEQNAHAVKVKQGSTNHFFNKLTDGEKERLPTYEGDLLLINHSAGTLTSATIMKRWNRKNEQMAFAAEVAAVTAMLHAGTPYPAQKIKDAWYRTIQSQFHDILPGTSTPTAYEYSQNDEIVALKTWDAILNDSASSIAPYVKGEGNILLFNPLGELRRDVVKIQLDDWNEENGYEAIAIDSENQEIPVQIHKTENNTYIATFIPKLRPFSWNRYEIKAIASEIKNPVKITKENGALILENSIYCVKITREGCINSIYNKKIQKELLKNPIAYEFQREKPKTFPAWNMDWKDRKKPPFLRIEEGGSVSILEHGPLRCTLQINFVYNESRFVREVSLSHNSEIVEFIERIHWREKACSLKLALHTTLKNPVTTFNWETSRIKRGVNNPKLYEMPSRYWVDLSEKNWGISLIEDSKYGFDKPNDETLRMTLIYTPRIRKLQAYKDQGWHDWGEHTVKYGIFSHTGDYTRTDHLARRFNQPVRSYSIIGSENETEKKNLDLFEVSNEQIGILAVKKAEDSDGIIIRLYERYGKNVIANLSFYSEIINVIQVNGREKHIQDIEFSNNTFTAKIEANGIRSYLVKLKSVTKIDYIEQEPLDLDFNFQLIGMNDDNQGLFPAELTPSEIPAGLITFKLSTNLEKNALQCHAQKISIPEGFSSLSILTGSEEEISTSFKFLDANGNIIDEKKCNILPLTGFLGQWDTRIWQKKPTHFEELHRDYIWIKPGKCIGIKPGYVKGGRLEWFTTHIHKNGEDQAYKFGYLYTLTLDIPNEAKSFLLPDDIRIFIIAATASNRQVKLISTQHLHDKYDF